MPRFNVLSRRRFLETVGSVAGLAVLPLAAGSTSAQSNGLSGPGAGDWSRFGYDLQNTRFNAAETLLGPDNVGRLRLNWKFNAQGVIQTTPIVVGDSVFFGSQSGHLYSLDTQSGERRWQFEVESRQVHPYMRQGIRTSPHYQDGRLYFGDNMTKVYCVDAESGKKIWETQLSEDPTAQTKSSPTVFNGKVILGYSSRRGDAEIVALDAETGAVSWRFSTAPEGAGGSVWASPAIDEKEHIVYNATGSVKAFMPAAPMLYAVTILAHDLETGELLWYYQPWRADPFDLDFGCSPMIFDAVIPSGYRGGGVRKCIGAGSKGGFFCCDRFTGELFWKVMLTNSSSGGGPILDSTATAYNRIYIASNALGPKKRMSVTAALDAYTGDIIWWNPNDVLNRAPVAVANGVFYQGLMDGTVEALDAETGAQRWEFKLPTAHRGGISVANGALYVGNGENAITEEEASQKQYSLYSFTIDGQ